jgi:hypothetical protein
VAKRVDGVVRHRLDGAMERIKEVLEG